MQIRSITVDRVDPYRQAAFWSQATGWQEDPNDPNHPGDPEGRLVSVHGINLRCIPVPEAKVVKNRVHLDLVPQDRTRRSAGRATPRARRERRRRPTGWVVMADPAGNEFCVERSAAERGE